MLIVTSCIILGNNISFIPFIPNLKKKPYTFSSKKGNSTHYFRCQHAKALVALKPLPGICDKFCGRGSRIEMRSNSLLNRLSTRSVDMGYGGPVGVDLPIGKIRVTSSPPFLMILDIASLHLAYASGFNAQRKVQSKTKSYSPAWVLCSSKKFPQRKSTDPGKFSENGCPYDRFASHFSALLTAVGARSRPVAVKPAVARAIASCAKELQASDCD